MIAPKSATIELTHRCNLCCKTCFANSSQAASAAFLPIGTLYPLIDELLDMGVSSFLIAGGEPLLYGQFLQVLEKILARGIPPGIATNGLLLTQDLCEQLRDVGVGHNVYVSLDGSNRRTYRYIRGVDAFESVLKGLANLAKVRIKFAVSTVVVRPNASEIPSIYEIASRYQASYLNLIRFNLEGRGIVHAEDLRLRKETFQDLTRRYANQWGGRIGFFGENCIIPVCASALPSLPDETDMRQFVVIRANGDVRLARASAGIQIGNVFSEKGFKAIWRSNTARRYLDDMDAQAFMELVQQKLLEEKGSP